MPLTNPTFCQRFLVSITLAPLAKNSTVSKPLAASAGARLAVAQLCVTAHLMTEVPRALTFFAVVVVDLRFGVEEPSRVLEISLCFRRLSAGIPLEEVPVILSQLAVSSSGQ